MSSAVEIWIVNFESSTLVDKCIRSLPDRGAARVIVLDNGSSEDDYHQLVEVARKHPSVHMIRSDTNLGFGEGHNLISRHSHAKPDDLVWLLNPDVEVLPGALAGLKEVLDDSRADIVSPAIVMPRDGATRLWFSGGSIDTARGSVVDSQLGRDPLALEGAPELLPTGFITGTAPMMRRDVWDALGGFRPDLHLYWEDVDLSLRAAAMGLRMAVATGARVEHAEGKSSRSSKALRVTSYWFMSRNRVLVCRRPGTRGIGLVLGPGTGALARLMAYSTAREGRGRVRRLFAIAGGAITALRTSPNLRLER